MAKYKIGDTIHKIGEKQLRPLKIEAITEDGEYVFEDKGLYLDSECDDLFELVTDETYRHYTKQGLFYSLIPRPPKIELDEKKIRELLESSEMTSRFSIQEYIEHENLKRAFVRDANGDMMRNPIDDL